MPRRFILRTRNFAQFAVSYECAQYCTTHEGCIPLPPFHSINFGFCPSDSPGRGGGICGVEISMGEFYVAVAGARAEIGTVCARRSP